MIFVDTGAWAALFVTEDPLHRVAQDWFRKNREPLVTSDYVIDELLTLLKVRFSAQVAIEAGEALWRQDLCTVVFLAAGDIQEAWRIFRTHRDKGWSFTDCTSNAIMARLQISQAFSFDKHFSQMRGFRKVP